MKERDLRLKSIKKIIKSNKIQSQDDLLKRLNEEGIEVTQATLSRDLKFLKVGKISDGHSGYVYTIQEDDFHQDSHDLFAQDFMRGYLSIEFSGNIVVIKTVSGYADSVSNAIDSFGFEEILGTIAGDNCIFACLKEGVSHDEFIESLKSKIPDFED